MKEKEDILNGKLIIALSRSLQELHKESEVMFQAYHLTFTQFAVLEALYHKGDMTIKAVMEAILSTSGNMTVVIRNLEKKGLLERICNPEDQRSFVLHLTGKGNSLIADVYERHMQLVETKLSVVTNAEKEMVIQILRKI